MQNIATLLSYQQDIVGGYFGACCIFSDNFIFLTF